MTGLRQKILSATSEAEVSNLMVEGKTYEFASVQTRNSWKNAANRVNSGQKYTATTTEGGTAKKKARRSR